MIIDFSMEIFYRIAEAFVLGVIGGSVPGPVLTAVFTEVINGGFMQGLKVIFRALTAELILVSFILLVVLSINIPQAYFYIISLAGAVFLIYLASNIWKIEKLGGEGGKIFNFSRMFVLTLFNGAFWIFWLTVCAPMAFAIKEQILGGQFIFLITFELGWLVMTAFLAFIFSKFRPFLFRKNLVSFVFKIFALILLFFAGRSVYESAAYFLK